MPIKAVVNGGAYQSLPVQDEDVTPVDRSISRMAQKSFQFVLFGCCMIIIGLVAVVVWYQRKEGLVVSVFETSLGKSSKGMSQLLLEDMTSPGFSAASVSFGNVQCDRGAEDTLCTNMTPQPSVIEIFRSTRYQEIVGFGGAFTEASAVNFYKLPTKIQDKVINMYFGNSGSGYSLGRIHINSCDFSLSSYSFDDVEGDVELKSFDSEVTHDQEYILPFIRAAMEKSRLPIKLLASPWSPPAWMKNRDSNGAKEMSSSAMPNGLKDDSNIKTAWAKYISKFISAYSEHDVPIWSVTPQNEPEFPAPWEACAYTADYERDFVQNYLGPVLRQDHPHILILGFDHNKDHLEAWTKTLMAPTKAAEVNYFDGMAFHWYSGGDRIEDGTYGYDAINASHHFSPGALLLATEGCSCPDVEIGNWLRAERLGHDIIFDLQNHAQGWIDWNLLVDSEGGPNHKKNYCDAALVTNKDFSDIYVQPKYHYMQHFSKFIPPGAWRVHSFAVGNFNFESMDPNIQAGVEVGMFTCERSVRQTWRLVAPTNVSKANATSHSCQYIQLSSRALTQDVSYNVTVELCIAQSLRLPTRTALRLADCTDDRASFIKVTQNSMGQLVEAQTKLCLSFIGDVREPGALLELATCKKTAATSMTTSTATSNLLRSQGKAKLQYQSVAHQLFAVNINTGEITAPKVDKKLCLTAGWPFLTAVAFTYPEVEAEHVLTSRQKVSVVVMNEAAVDSQLVVWDRESNGNLGVVIHARAIQTIVF